MNQALSHCLPIGRRAAMLAAAIAIGVSGAALAGGGSDDIPKIAVERYTLDNGLEVILHRDNSVPVVAVDVWYHVGSGNEVPGRSGFAHLFEHMLFQGSTHVGEDRHFEILKNIGATGVNGSTNTDRTNYYEVVPSHQLETALWLESDRMGYFLPMLTQKSLTNQIEVVRNERRQNYDTRPYGTTWLALHKALYPDAHPYRYMTIGLHDDLAAASLEDVRNFYKRWYSPSNATLVLAGDFDTAQAKQMIQKWFGSFPKSEKPKVTPVPLPNIDAASVEVKDKFAKLRMLTYAWHTPATFDGGDAEFDILAHTLGHPGTGRLYQELVHKEQVAQRVTAFQWSKQFSSIFIIQVQLRSGADLDKVKRIVDKEIAKVQLTELSKRELERAVTSFESQYIWGLEGMLRRAELLQGYNHYVGTPDYITQDLNRYRGATAINVRKFAKQFLANDRRIEIITVPDDTGAKGAK